MCSNVNVGLHRLLQQNNLEENIFFFIENFSFFLLINPFVLVRLSYHPHLAIDEVM